MADPNQALATINEIRKTLKQARSQQGRSDIRRSPHDDLWFALKQSNRTAEQLCESIVHLLHSYDPFSQEYTETMVTLNHARKNIRQVSHVLARHQKGLN